MLLLRLYTDQGRGGRYIDLPPGEYARLADPTQGEFEDRVSSWAIIDGDDPPGGQAVQIPPAYQKRLTPTAFGDYQDVLDHPDRVRIEFFDYRDFNAGRQGEKVWRKTGRTSEEALTQGEDNDGVASLKWGILPMPPDRAAAINQQRSQIELEEQRKRIDAAQQQDLQRELQDQQAALERARREAERRQVQKERDRIQREIDQLNSDGQTPPAGPQGMAGYKTYELVAELGGRIVPAGTRGAQYSVVDTPQEGTGLAGNPGAWDQVTGGAPPASWGLPVKLLASDGYRARPVANSWMNRRFGPSWASSLT